MYLISLVLKTELGSIWQTKSTLMWTSRWGTGCSRDERHISHLVNKHSNQYPIYWFTSKYSRSVILAQVLHPICWILKFKLNGSCRMLISNGPLSLVQALQRYWNISHKVKLEEWGANLLQSDYDRCANHLIKSPGCHPCLYITITILLWVPSIYHFIKHYPIVILS